MKIASDIFQCISEFSRCFGQVVDSEAGPGRKAKEKELKESTEKMARMTASPEHCGGVVTGSEAVIIRRFDRRMGQLPRFFNTLRTLVVAM